MTDSARTVVSADLDEFDERLAAELTSDPGLLGDIGRNLIQAGGKRIRPRLALLAARLLDGAGSRDGMTVAMAVEMLHTASLLHDDLIDEAPTRRGQETAHQRFGSTVSVMAGDFLLARVLRLLALEGHNGLMLLMSDVAATICEAEIRQYELAGTDSYSFSEYLKVIEGKTAVLISAALEGVALLASSPAEERQAVRNYGLHYGRAFQLRDDLLDLTGDVGDLGKPGGTDLREGKVTWPVLLLLDMGYTEARDIVGRRAARDGDAARMKELLEESGAVRQTLERIREETEAAEAALAVFPDSAAKTALKELAAAEAGRSS